MRIAAIAIAAVICASSGTAHADNIGCKPDMNGQAMSIEKVIAKAESMGYAVKKAKQSKGCWRIEGFDRNGAEIEIRFDPASGDVVKKRERTEAKQPPT